MEVEGFKAAEVSKACQAGYSYKSSPSRTMSAYAQIVQEAFPYLVGVQVISRVCHALCSFDSLSKVI